MKTNTLCCAGLLPSCLVAALFRPSCASRCLFHVFHLSNCIGCAVRMSRTSQRLRPESSFGVDLVPQLPEPKINNIAFSSNQKVDSTHPFQQLGILNVSQKQKTCDGDCLGSFVDAKKQRVAHWQHSCWRNQVVEGLHKQLFHAITEEVRYMEST